MGTPLANAIHDANVDDGIKQNGNNYRRMRC